ncbi:MAG: hypothetical protein ACKVHO_00450 [Verrucomicrobiia bacterium]|jgi:hypothetical protein
MPTGSGDAPGFDLVTIAENNLRRRDGNWFERGFDLRGYGWDAKTDWMTGKRRISRAEKLQTAKSKLPRSFNAQSEIAE